VAQPDLTPWLASHPTGWRDKIEVLTVEASPASKLSPPKELPDGVAVLDPFSGAPLRWLIENVSSTRAGENARAPAENYEPASTTPDKQPCHGLPFLHSRLR